jgi:exopolyphosphatase
MRWVLEAGIKEGKLLSVAWKHKALKLVVTRSFQRTRALRAAAWGTPKDPTRKARLDWGRQAFKDYSIHFGFTFASLRPTLVQTDQVTSNIGASQQSGRSKTKRKQTRTKTKPSTMSRFSIATFLSQAKRQLQQASKNEATTSFVVGNESADLDSITSALVYSYIKSSHPDARRTNTLTIPVTNIPASDLALRPELTTLLSHANLKPSDLITLDDLPPLSPSKTSWTLVDHNALTGQLASTYSASATIAACIDHHDDESFVPATATPRIITKTGSCCSLITTHLHEPWVQLALFSSSIGAANGQQSYLVIDDTAYTSTWDAQVALLALGAILIDTQNLTSTHKVTKHDSQAVKLLEAFVNMSPRLSPKYDREAFYAKLDAAKSDISALSLTDILRKDYKAWSDNGLALGIASVVQGLPFLREKADAEAGSKDALVPACVEFAKERSLGLFAVMTAFTNPKGDFERELLLLATEEGKPSEAAKKFVERSAGELKLVELDQPASEEGISVAWIGVWRQDNLEASRKQVAPLLREAMKA